MAMHETVRRMTDGQKNDIIATMVGAIPLLTFDEAQRIIGDKGPFVADIGEVFRRRKGAADIRPTTYPAVGEVFELTLDGDVPENQPLEMVRRDGYSPEGWQHTGRRVEGLQTCRFKLVLVGYCRSFNELMRKLVNHGTIPEGQWREALKAAYKHDGKGPVGIADSSWVNPYGRAHFPFVSTHGRSLFYWTDFDFSDSWRWLVEVSK